MSNEEAKSEQTYESEDAAHAAILAEAEELAAVLAQARADLEDLGAQETAVIPAEITNTIQATETQISRLNIVLESAVQERKRYIPEALSSERKRLERLINDAVERIKAHFHRAPAIALKTPFSVEVDSTLSFSVPAVAAVPVWNTKAFLESPLARTVVADGELVVQDVPTVNEALLELAYQSGDVPPELHHLRREAPKATPRVLTVDPTAQAAKAKSKPARASK